MRVGLLTRFWGSLGMALGVSILFLGLLGMLVFFAAVGALIAGLWPRGRPPAWAAGRGRAVADAAARSRPRQPDDPDRPADPEQFTAAIEGSATEVSGDGEAGRAGAVERRRASASGAALGASPPSPARPRCAP